MKPLKIISIEEYESKKKESRRVLHRAQQRIGFVSGVNFAKLSGEDVDSSSRTLFGFGAVLDLNLGKNIVLRLEPMYLQKGAEHMEYMGSRRKTKFWFRPRSKTAPMPKTLRPEILASDRSTKLALEIFKPPTKPIRCWASTGVTISSALSTTMTALILFMIFTSYPSNFFAQCAKDSERIQKSS